MIVLIVMSVVIILREVLTRIIVGHVKTTYLISLSHFHIYIYICIRFRILKQGLGSKPFDTPFGYASNTAALKSPRLSTGTSWSSLGTMTTGTRTGGGVAGLLLMHFLNLTCVMALM